MAGNVCLTLIAAEREAGNKQQQMIDEAQQDLDNRGRAWQSARAVAATRPMRFEPSSLELNGIL